MGEVTTRKCTIIACADSKIDVPEPFFRQRWASVNVESKIRSISEFESDFPEKDFESFQQNSLFCLDEFGNSKKEETKSRGR